MIKKLHSFLEDAFIFRYSKFIPTARSRPKVPTSEVSSWWSSRTNASPYVGISPSQKLMNSKLEKWLLHALGTIHWKLIIIELCSSGQENLAKQSGRVARNRRLPSSRFSYWSCSTAAFSFSSYVPIGVMKALNTPQLFNSRFWNFSSQTELIPSRSQVKFSFENFNAVWWESGFLIF